MLDAVDGLLGLASEVGQAKPHEHGAGDVVALDARLAALVFLDAGVLFEFAVKLLDLPVHAVFTKPNSGTFVSSTALNHLAQNESAAVAEPDFSPVSTLEVRLVLEPAIVRRAADRGVRDKAAEKFLDQMDEVKDISVPAQRTLWNQSDRMFHRQLSVMTGDALLVELADELAKTMDQSLWKRIKDEGIYEPSRIRLYAAEHRLIYEAIIAGDADGAAFYVERHLTRVLGDIAPK